MLLNFGKHTFLINDLVSVTIDGKAVVFLTEKDETRVKIRTKRGIEELRPEVLEVDKMCQIKRDEIEKLRTNPALRKEHKYQIALRIFRNAAPAQKIGQNEYDTSNSN